jgi:hypothetical protein
VIAIDNGFRCIVGYEESGATLAYMYGDAPEPQSMTFDELLNLDNHFGWLFVGERTRELSLAQIYRDVIIDLPSVLTTKTQSYVCGAEAFRAWANDIDGGRFDGMKPEDFESWGMHQNFVCMLATNSGGCQSFLERAMVLNPDFAFLEAVREQYRETSYMWMGMYDNLPPPDGAARDNLEALGGGFNVTLEALQNPEKRAKIAALLRKFADCMDEVVRILNDGLKACREGENK